VHGRKALEIISVKAGSVSDGVSVGREKLAKEDRSQKESRAEQELMLARYTRVKSQLGRQ